MQKFVVVSYDNDEQQWFWDYVAARNAESAAAKVCTKRPYVIAAEACTPEELRDLAHTLEKVSLEQIADNFKRTIKEA